MDEVFLPLHHDLVHELENAGFRPKSDADPGVYVGEIPDAEQSWLVEIALRSPYPEKPPKVRLIGDERPRGWHEEADGAMCLYPNSPSSSFPWLARGDLRESIAGWCKQNDAGWPADSPDLDLNRYWPTSSRHGLVIHRPLEEGCTGWMSLDLVPGTRTLRARDSFAPPRKRAKSHPHRYALLRDIGELALPVASWDGLKRLLGDADAVMDEVLACRARLLLLRYTRSGHVGSLALEPWVTAAKRKEPSEGAGLRVTWSSVETAQDGPAVVDLRRGPYLADLRTKRVALVGVGGIGSYVAYALHRAGVGCLTLVDFETLRPGNMARHAADPAFVGWKKAVAMAKTLAGDPQVIDAVPGAVRSRSEAHALTDTHDLVVDATGSETVTQLLLLAGTGHPVVCTYLKNQGRSRVVEVLHSASDERAEPTRMAPLGVNGYESGCGDPVSPTPLYAVQEVAAMTTRIVVDLLLGHEATTELRETP